jgi:hypothetical protein
MKMISDAENILLPTVSVAKLGSSQAPHLTEILDTQSTSDVQSLEQNMDAAAAAAIGECNSQSTSDGINQIHDANCEISYNPGDNDDPLDTHSDTNCNLQSTDAAWNIYIFRQEPLVWVRALPPQPPRGWLVTLYKSPGPTSLCKRARKGGS